MTPNSKLYFSRLRLRRDASIAALIPMLLPEDEGARIESGHRLLWSVFADGPDRRRDFLWREKDRGVYYVLSQRPPALGLGLFEIDTKRFEPSLAPGDLIRFALRANAVATRKNEQGKAKRFDLVFEKLRALPQGDRAAQRDTTAQDVGSSWLAEQGKKHGFSVETCETVAYRRAEFSRNEGRGKPVVFGLLDLEGVIRVTDPAALLAAIALGFGKAKGFGCGLMLIRRA